MSNQTDEQQTLDTPVESEHDAAGQLQAEQPAAEEQSSVDTLSGVESEHAHAEHDPLAPVTLMHHVKDDDSFYLPRAIAGNKKGQVKIPQLREQTTPIEDKYLQTGSEAIDRIFPIERPDFKITKFMVLELIGALVLIAVFVPLARKVRSGGPPRGRIWNLLELMVVFIRDQVARPTIGSHDAATYTPYLLTLFFFILACNLMGLVPWAGSPTGALAVTGTLALITFATTILAGSLKLGVVGFWAHQVPSMDVPFVIGIVLKPMIWLLEVVGMCIKHSVLAMRLLANMMAGHMVLGVLVAFIAVAGKLGILALCGIAPASILGAVALSLLELFVAFLQAYIFVFLAGLFIGMAVHPH